MGGHISAVHWITALMTGMHWNGMSGGRENLQQGLALALVRYMCAFVTAFSQDQLPQSGLPVRHSHVVLNAGGLHHQQGPHKGECHAGFHGGEGRKRPENPVRVRVRVHTCARARVRACGLGTERKYLTSEGFGRESRGWTLLRSRMW